MTVFVAIWPPYTKKKKKKERPRNTGDAMSDSFSVTVL